MADTSEASSTEADSTPTEPTNSRAEEIAGFVLVIGGGVLLVLIGSWMDAVSFFHAQKGLLQTYTFGDLQGSAVAYSMPIITLAVLFVVWRWPKVPLIWFGWTMLLLNTLVIGTCLLIYVTSEVAMGLYLAGEGAVGIEAAMEYQNAMTDRFAAGEKIDRSLLAPLMVTAGWGLLWYGFVSVREDTLAARGYYDEE